MTTKAAVNYSGPIFAPHLIICAWQCAPAGLAKGLAMAWQHRDSVGQWQMAAALFIAPARLPKVSAAQRVWHSCF